MFFYRGNLRKENELKRKIAIMAIGCLLILMASLLGCGGKGSSIPQDRTISGKISYTGPVNPTHQIVVVAGRVGEQDPAYSTVLQQPGTYTLSNVTDASYYVFAFMDLGDDMGPPEANEPNGYYDSNGDGQGDQVIMIDGKGLTNIDITLQDPE